MPPFGAGTLLPARSGSVALYPFGRIHQRVDADTRKQRWGVRAQRHNVSVTGQRAFAPPSATTTPRPHHQHVRFVV